MKSIIYIITIVQRKRLSNYINDNWKKTNIVIIYIITMSRTVTEDPNVIIPTQ